MKRYVSSQFTWKQSNIWDYQTKNFTYEHSNTNLNISLLCFNNLECNRVSFQARNLTFCVVQPTTENTDIAVEFLPQIPGFFHSYIKKSNSLIFQVSLIETNILNWNMGNSINNNWISHLLHNHHPLNIFFLPQLIMGIDGSFPTAYGRQPTFSDTFILEFSFSHFRENPV